jgi:hypothetical protein
MRLIIEEALEAEVRDAIGRDYYEHGAEPYRSAIREHLKGQTQPMEDRRETASLRVDRGNATGFGLRFVLPPSESRT